MHNIHLYRPKKKEAISFDFEELKATLPDEHLYKFEPFDPFKVAEVD